MGVAGRLVRLVARHHPPRLRPASTPLSSTSITLLATAPLLPLPVWAPPSAIANWFWWWWVDATAHRNLDPFIATTAVAEGRGDASICLVPSPRTPPARSNNRATLVTLYHDRLESEVPTIEVDELHAYAGG